ncbi:uncharacterized protein PGTG_22201 [Puccinia graminis f. sp. tritici CRL 75-36-700-3]|uniref:SWIM-type domain-containing protein n=2 Tax=Puccinia graminis f. sp. tritici TaxID=56615 RepID=H6QTZ0_PUCGT|nr:uncharacterized protein PGTG_22201 [Puccinia graminis f. sp. tritici CRL 75-36-700-3]EHS64404.1 hypothetical protein PGTG_22201 [Puccinia graminis f. sp. tritici CRL 75-36-700-3]
MAFSLETGDDDNAFEVIFNRQLEQIDSTELTDQQIHALHVICGPDILLASLELLDHKAVRKLVLKNGQALYEVQGNEAIYHVQLGFKDSCTCRTFIDGVIIKGRQTMCAHLLAVRIGFRLGSIETQEISLENLVTIFSGS